MFDLGFFIILQLKINVNVAARRVAWDVLCTSRPVRRFLSYAGHGRTTSYAGDVIGITSLQGNGARRGVKENCRSDTLVALLTIGGS